jgi:hypothetical protein
MAERRLICALAHLKICLFQQFRDLRIQNLCDTVNHAQGRISLSPFYLADIGEIQAAGICQLLLGNPPLQPQLPHCLSELTANLRWWIHLSKISGEPERALVTIVINGINR